MFFNENQTKIDLLGLEELNIPAKLMFLDH